MSLDNLAYSPWPENRFLFLLAFVWMLPLTVIGFWFFSLMAMFSGLEQYEWRHGVLFCQPKGWFLCLVNGWGAFTFGLTIFCWDRIDFQSDKLQHHELVHVHQQTISGSFHPLIYLVCFVFSVIRYRRFSMGYWRNPLELDAYRQAGQMSDYPQLTGLS